MAQDQKITNIETQPQRTKRPKTYPPREEIKTLFVSGFPTDVHEREIHNLFRFFSGYEGCILNLETPQKQPVAFVSFAERDSAVRAMRYLQGARFDLTSPQTLRIDFAKSNSKIKRLSPRDLFTSEKRSRSPVGGAPYYPSYPQYNTPGYGMGSLSSSLIPWFNNLNINDNNFSIPPPFSSPHPHVSSYGTAPYPPAPSKVPPCTTLFVANIHPDVVEKDLLRFFRTTTGFTRLKVSQKDGAPICFVEYADVPSSTSVMQTFQGFPVGPSQIRIEYARAKMGEGVKRQRDYQNLEQGKQKQDTDTPHSPTQSTHIHSE
jgi:RNA recognition motif-containing protein